MLRRSKACSSKCASAANLSSKVWLVGPGRGLGSDSQLPRFHLQAARRRTGEVIAFEGNAPDFLWSLVVKSGDGIPTAQSCGSCQKVAVDFSQRFSRKFSSKDGMTRSGDRRLPSHGPGAEAAPRLPSSAGTPGRDVPWPSARKCRLELGGDGWKWMEMGHSETKHLVKMRVSRDFQRSSRGF